MQIGVSTWVWTSPLTDAGLAEIAPRAAAMGFDLVELPLESLDDWDPIRSRATLAEHGLGATACAVMPPDRDLISPDAAVRENAERYLRRAIEIAAAVGSRTLVGPIYASVGRTWLADAARRERDLTAAAEALRRLADHAGEHGVVLGIEPLNRFETSFVNIAAQAIELVDRVASPALGILLDTFHMNIEERSLPDAIRACGPRLCQLHACENDRGAPGTGHVEWEAVAEALHAVAFDGPVVIETFTSDVVSIARAAAVWRPVATSQDELAASGGAFLRSLLA